MSIKAACKLLLIWSLLSANLLNAETLTGKVIHIADGDSITIMRDNTQYKIRLLGIDAPERDQPFGKQARVALNRAINGKIVNAEWNKKDNYGRLVAKVSYKQQDIGLQQIQKGMAWHYKHYAREQDPEDQSRYAQAEYQAQRDKQGLWQDAKPIPPWDYRHKRSR